MDNHCGYHIYDIIIVNDIIKVITLLGARFFFPFIIFIIQSNVFNGIGN